MTICLRVVGWAMTKFVSLMFEKPSPKVPEKCWVTIKNDWLRYTMQTKDLFNEGVCYGCGSITVFNWSDNIWLSDPWPLISPCSHLIMVSLRQNQGQCLPKCHLEWVRVGKNLINGCLIILAWTFRAVGDRWETKFFTSLRIPSQTKPWQTRW